MKMDDLDAHMQCLIATMLASLEDAAWAWKELAFQKIGVYTAAEPADFLVPMFSYLASRTVSSLLRVDGPAEHFESACSSSYLATHQALHDMKQGKCQTAVIGGVSLMLRPQTHTLLHELDVLSKSGIMVPLDVSSDGMVWGEACSAAVLQKNPTPEATYVTLAGSAMQHTSTLFPMYYADQGL